MQLQKQEFGQETNCSCGKRSRICDGQKQPGLPTLCFSCESASSFLACSRHCCQRASCWRGGDWRGWVPGTALPAPRPAFPFRSRAGSILFARGGLAGSCGSHHELVQLVARKAGLLLGEEGFVAGDDLHSS